MLKEGYKLDDRCLRNEILILINYIVTSPASHKFMLERDSPDHASFLEMLIWYATHDELNQQINFVGDGTAKSIKPLFTTRDEDVEFKKLLWTSILYTARSPENSEAHQTLIEKDFVHALLVYIDPNNNSMTT